MKKGPMSTRDSLPAVPRSAAPGTPVRTATLCALGALLAAVPARAQSDRPVPAPAPATPDVEDVTSRAADAASAQASERPASTVRLPAATDAAEVLLSRALGEPSETAGPGPDLESLRDFLPNSLFRDVVELRDRVVRVRSRLFGRRGIVSLGRTDEGGELGRVRLNLQYDPDPGIRVTLVTP